MELVECFSAPVGTTITKASQHNPCTIMLVTMLRVYVAILSCNEPHYRVVDLLAYQHLFTQANQEYHADC